MLLSNSWERSLKEYPDNPELLRHVSSVIVNMERLLLQTFLIMLGLVYFILGFASPDTTSKGIHYVLLLGIQLFLTFVFYFIQSNLVVHYTLMDEKFPAHKRDWVRALGVASPIFHVLTFLAPLVLWGAIAFVLIEVNQVLNQRWYVFFAAPCIFMVLVLKPFLVFLGTLLAHLLNEKREEATSPETEARGATNAGQTVS